MRPTFLLHRYVIHWQKPGTLLRGPVENSKIQPRQMSTPLRTQRKQKTPLSNLKMQWVKKMMAMCTRSFHLLTVLLHVLLRFQKYIECIQTTQATQSNKRLQCLTSQYPRRRKRTKMIQHVQKTRKTQKPQKAQKP